MKKTFSLLSLGSLLLLALPGMTQVRPDATRAVGKRIARTAPLVFIGRPLIGALHEDSVGCHCLYEVSYIEVLQVLRGNLLPGRIELLSPIPASFYRGQNDGLRQMSRLGGTRGFAPATVGIYFVQGSEPRLPTRLQASALRPPQLLSYEQRPEAKIILDPSSLEAIYGLNRQWASPRRVWHYLARVPRLEPVNDSLLKESLPASH